MRSITWFIVFCVFMFIALNHVKETKRCDCQDMLGTFKGWHFCTCYSGRPGC
ncbi:unnamed protein product [Arabidopsis lyrata]|uniref:Uncharacterized protein n=1 Tax=Arabidopsis lyrata subsp. lyrata TaxID=81972 RepID=D7LA77_ARALL|nr:hypothetical protein ARALYDRAFT_899438 [Arabidopsis lyrata subsp. lyrata]CAH8262063.1 unnamed protein product [Arabidopsis lyrata]